MYPVLPFADRTALKDEVIPLSESIVTTAGKRLDRIHIRKGEFVSIAIASYQRLFFCTYLFSALTFIQDGVTVGKRRRQV